MDTTLPLNGVRILEFCNVAAGPYCGMLLADMGADVIKIEHPKGETPYEAGRPSTRATARTLLR